MVKPFQFRIQFGVLLAKFLRPAKEGFGGHGEKFGRIRGGVGIDQGGFTALKAGLERFKFARHHAKPCRVSFMARAMRFIRIQQRRAIRITILVIQLMGELVKDHTGASATGQVALDLGPREHE